MFLINLVLAKVRSDEGIALATASSGIAATLLDGGTTAHSRFKIPIDIQSDSTCNIPAQSHLAELIHETQLVFWDRRRCNIDIHLRWSIVHLRIFTMIFDHLEVLCSVS